GLVGLPRGDQRALDLRRRAIAALDRAGRTDAATAELEAAVRAAPRELALAFELARRYGPARGVAVLVRIEDDHPLDANVLAVVADQLVAWQRRALAVEVYDRIAAVTPDEFEPIVALGRAYAGAGPPTRAVAR